MLDAAQEIQVNRSLLYLSACMTASICLAREIQVKMRIEPTGLTIT
jgi:hypothetical protein